MGPPQGESLARAGDPRPSPETSRGPLQQTAPQSSIEAPTRCSKVPRHPKEACDTVAAAMQFALSVGCRGQRDTPITRSPCAAAGSQSCNPTSLCLGCLRLSGHSSDSTQSCSQLQQREARQQQRLSCCPAPPMQRGVEHRPQRVHHNHPNVGSLPGVRGAPRRSGGAPHHGI